MADFGIFFAVTEGINHGSNGSLASATLKQQMHLKNH